MHIINTVTNKVISSILYKIPAHGVWQHEPGSITVAIDEEDTVNLLNFLFPSITRALYTILFKMHEIYFFGHHIDPEE